jgi:predicted phage tail protein
MVRMGQRLYQAAQTVPVDTPPPDPEYWLDIGKSIETANGLAEQVAFNTAEIIELDGEVTAQATAFQALRASWREDDGNGDLADALKGWTSTAAIASESKVRTSENEAMSQRITTFDVAIGENAANITELEQVVATNELATATKIDQLNVSVGQNTAAIQQTSTAYADTAGKLTTMWSVKMQVTAGGQYVAAGIGLGIENTGAGLQSQFLVSADRFAIVNTIAGGAISVPFAVQGGQVFMNSAFIADGTITNAKIGSYISSTNYIAGQQGWILNKDGTLEINGIVPGQGRLVINSLNVSVYDANNVLRVRLGYLG